MGMSDFARARIRVSGSLPWSGEMRLVVQVHEVDTRRPVGRARPVAAAQRIVTAADLEDGVELSLLHEGKIDEAARVVAWLEPGSSELEFGALTADPRGAIVEEHARLRDHAASVEFVSPGAGARAA